MNRQDILEDFTGRMEVALKTVTALFEEAEKYVDSKHPDLSPTNRQELIITLCEFSLKVIGVAD